jgi:hypothetical protein
VTDENVQYFFLAAYNFFSDPVEGKLPSIPRKGFSDPYNPLNETSKTNDFIIFYASYSDSLW